MLYSAYAIILAVSFQTTAYYSGNYNSIIARYMHSEALIWYGFVQ